MVLSRSRYSRSCSVSSCIFFHIQTEPQKAVGRPITALLPTVISLKQSSCSCPCVHYSEIGQGYWTPLVTYLCFVLFASFTLGMPPTRFLECTVHPLDILDQYVCLVGVIMLPVKHHPDTMGFGNCLPLPSMSGFLVYESHSVPVIG